MWKWYWEIYNLRQPQAVAQKKCWWWVVWYSGLLLWHTQQLQNASYSIFSPDDSQSSIQQHPQIMKLICTSVPLALNLKGVCKCIMSLETSTANQWQTAPHFFSCKFQLQHMVQLSFSNWTPCQLTVRLLGSHPASTANKELLKFSLPVLATIGDHYSQPILEPWTQKADYKTWLHWRETEDSRSAQWPSKNAVRVTTTWGQNSSASFQPSVISTTILRGIQVQSVTDAPHRCQCLIDIFEANMSMEHDSAHLAATGARGASKPCRPVLTLACTSQNSNLDNAQARPRTTLPPARSSCGPEQCVLFRPVAWPQTASQRWSGISGQPSQDSPAEELHCWRLQALHPARTPLSAQPRLSQRPCPTAV